MTQDAKPTFYKVPALTAAFWAMKICATTLGETAGDLVSMTLKAGYAVSSLVLLASFLISLTGQLAVKRYHPPLYWTVILTTSCAGTTMSDYMNRTLGLGYTGGTLILLGLVAASLVAWRLTIGSLAVDGIQSRRVEVFYWVTILFSNTLGTSLGDFLADESGLGFAGGALLIGGLLAVTLALYLFTKVSRVGLFWIAFVLTRPFGATMGDVLTKPKDHGGLDLGTVGASAVLGGILVVLVAIATVKNRRETAPALSR